MRCAETDLKLNCTQAELEEIAAGAEAGGAKGRAALRSPRALDLEALTTRHKQHIVRMEQVRPDVQKHECACWTVILVGGTRGHADCTAIYVCMKMLSLACPPQEL